MKKRILMLLCAAVLAISIAAPPALAAGGPFYPVSVEEYTYGSFDELRINKVYQLSLSDDPSGIPTEDFVRDGRRYYLLDLIKEDEVGVDTQDYTDTVTQDSDTNDLSVVLKQLDPHREVTTEDGYTGLLALDYTSVTVEAKALIESIDRVSVVISDKLKSPVRCRFEENRVLLSAKTGNGEAKDVCRLEGDGGGLEIGFNNRYLMEALRYAPAETVRIELNTGVSPAIIVPTDDKDNFLYMVLPVRLKNAE